VWQSASGQENWVLKELGSGLKVNFPVEPVYELRGDEKAATYRAKTDKNLFLIVVQYGVLPNYAEFVRLSKNEQQKGIEIFLDNAIKGLLTSSGNSNTPFRSSFLGNHPGRETHCSLINPHTGNSTTAYVRMVYAFNKIFLFQCMYLKDAEECKVEKEIFFNSISTD
jgi:hypothetical protein